MKDLNYRMRRIGRFVLDVLTLLLLTCSQIIMFTAFLVVLVGEMLWDIAMGDIKTLPSVRTAIKSYLDGFHQAFND